MCPTCALHVDKELWRPQACQAHLPEMVFAAPEESMGVSSASGGSSSPSRPAGQHINLSHTYTSIWGSARMQRPNSCCLHRHRHFQGSRNLQPRFLLLLAAATTSSAWHGMTLSACDAFTPTPNPLPERSPDGGPLPLTCPEQQAPELHTSPLSIADTACSTRQHT